MPTSRPRAIRVPLALAIAMLLFVPAAAASAGFYTIEVAFTSPFSGTVTAPAGHTCVQAPVPAPEIEVRCTPTFAATVCKSPSVTDSVVGFSSRLTVRSICGPGAQADCAAATAGFTLAASCSDDEPTLGSTLTQWVCHVVPGGGVIHYDAACTAYIG